MSCSGRIMDAPSPLAARTKRDAAFFGGCTKRHLGILQLAPALTMC